MIIPRTTLTMANRQSLTNLESIRQRSLRASAEISTGLRVRKGSDSPIEAAGVVRTNSDVRASTQYQQNLRNVSDQLIAADTALNEATNLATRANALALQAANFSQTAATRASIAVEVEGLIQNLITIANTSLGGKFLFGGRNEDASPFVADSASPDGVIYRGYGGRRSAAFPGGTESLISVDGRTVFLNPDSFVGSGRTAGTTGALTPNPPVGVGISFSGAITATISVDLPSFLVAAVPATVPSPGDQATFNFSSTDSAINGSISITLGGGETAAQIAALLNSQIALSPPLAGKISFSDEGGRLKIIESDSAGVGFLFTSSSTGGLTTGLESGGTVGGLSAEEIAAALNAQVALNPALTAARVRFSAVNGEIDVDGDVDFTFTAVDFARSTGFVSGLAGEHAVGGLSSANVFRVLQDLRRALLANDVAGIEATLDGLARSVLHLSNVQGFYGSTERQVLSAIDSLTRLELIHREKLSSLQDADLVRSISDLNQAQVNEEAALRVAASQPGRSLFDFLA